MVFKPKKAIPLHCQRSTLKTASRKDELLPLRSPFSRCPRQATSRGVEGALLVPAQSCQ
ncbi:hypothetical protein HMPREF1556_01644 [Porphyromonas sp. oral taxon 278 str. W7784]|nr:hypothetical protein HMPREF1556_01644 [Porphyromonas sp. oral taxon 278 str. W7784]